MSTNEPQILDFPLHIPTADSRQLVEHLVACDIDQESICYIIKATPFELRLHYAGELKHGLANATAQMAQSVFRAGIAGDMKAATFWLRSRAGWRETVRIDNPAETPQVQAKDKQQLIDRIVGLLTPAQAVAVLKAEAGETSQSAAKPGPTLN